MKERTSAIYKVVAEIGIKEMSDLDAAIHYAVMDLNKRGGGADVKGVLYIYEYYSILSGKDRTIARIPKQDYR